MSKVGQSGSDYIFVPGVKAKERMTIESSVLFFLFQCLKTRNVDIITMGPSFLVYK